MTVFPGVALLESWSVSMSAEKEDFESFEGNIGQCDMSNIHCTLTYVEFCTSIGIYHNDVEV